MRRDQRIQHDIIRNLRKDLSFYSSQIDVTVKNAMVLLSGVTDTYYRKEKAVNAAKRVCGVKAIGVEIEVDDSPGFGKFDFQMAEAVVKTLSQTEEVPIERLRVQVERGVVTVQGEVSWGYQFDAVEYAIGRLAGTSIIHNHVTVKPGIRQSIIHHYESTNKEI